MMKNKINDVIIQIVNSVQDIKLYSEYGSINEIENELSPLQCHIEELKTLVSCMLKDRKLGH
jgi:hypothetical protein